MIWKTIPTQRRLIEQAFKIAVRNIYTSNGLRKSLYEALELPSTATQADIKNAYFELSKKFHPDRIAATSENLARFREICAAYEVLGNEQSRKLYDRGFLGDIKKPVSDEIDEAIDPIIKFYQQRLELSKKILKPSSEIQSWTPSSKKYSASKISEKYNYFKPSSAINYSEIWYKDVMYIIIVWLTVFFLLLTNFEGSDPEKFCRKLSSIVFSK